MSQTSELEMMERYMGGLRKPTMDALVLVAPSTFEVQQRPIPEIGDDDLLVAVECSSVCGSDLRGQDFSTGRRGEGLVMGHENAGIVVKAGRSAHRFKVGDRVIPDSSVYCNECDACKSGWTNMCEKVQVLGVKCPEFTRHGGYANYVAVPQHICHKIPDGLSFEHACLFEPIAVAMNGVNLAKSRGLKSGDLALVCGVGNIGRFVVEILLSMGVDVIVYNRSEGRLDYCRSLRLPCFHQKDKEFTAADIVQVATDIKDRASRKIQYAFDVAGYPDSVAIALNSIAVGGTFVQIGDEGKSFEIWLQRMVKYQLCWQGVKAFPEACVPQALDAIATQKVNLEGVITWRGGLRDAVGLFANHEGISKPVISPWAQCS